LTGISACTQIEYRRAIVDLPEVENAIRVAKELDTRKDQPPPEGTRWFKIERGTLPAIITAPHATQPFREGQYRFSDGGGTAGLAVALHAICDVTVVFHASHPYRPYEVDLGTINGTSALGDKSFIPSLIDAFKKEGIVNISVDWFAASKNQTITRYASSKGVPSVQLEFSATRTSPGEDALAAHRFAQTLEAVARFLGTRSLCARIGFKKVKD
jgi:hypothetical protein